MSSDTLESKEEFCPKTAMSVLRGFRITLETKLGLGANSIYIEGLGHRIQNEKMTWEIFDEAIVDLESRVRYQVQTEVLRGTFVPRKILKRPKSSKNNLVGSLVNRAKMVLAALKNRGLSSGEQGNLVAA